MEIKDSLKFFGLNPKEREIYLLLIKTGWQTVLQLSRKAPITRTTLYRLLESLAQKGFVETKIDDKTTFYNAASPQQLESVVLEQENRARHLRQVFGQIQPSLQTLSALGTKETSVRFYRGLRGLKQLEWKKLQKPNTFTYIFDAGDLWYKHLGRDFAEKIREEIVKLNIKIYEIDNQENISPVPPHGLPDWTDNLEYVKHHFSNRAIPAKVIQITQDVYVLEDAVHIHGYRENDVMGIEIQSLDFARLMQELFKNLWNQAQAFDSTGGKNFR